MRRVLIGLLAATVAACTSDSSTGPGGSGDPLAHYIPAPPGPPWSGVATSVTVGEAAVCLLQPDGTPWCWGNRFHLGLPRIDDGLRGPNAGQLAASICTKNYLPDDMPGWPCNVLHPVRVSPNSYVSISEPVNDGMFCALDVTQKAFCWGQGAFLSTSYDSISGGVEYCGTAPCYYSPQRVRGGLLQEMVYPACALSAAGAPLCMGGNSYNLLGDTPTLFADSLIPVAGAPASTAVALSPFGRFACALATTGKVYCWGWNERGWGVGTDSTGNQVKSPTLIMSNLTFKSLATGSWSACAVSTGGTAYCWGYGGGGLLGWGGNGFSFKPVAVAGAHTFTGITGSGIHFCALDTGAAAWCWGSNMNGELGVARAACDGATFCSSSPVAVSGGHTFKQLSAGVAGTCGVTSAGEVYCWGATEYGRLGPGPNPNVQPFVSTPVKITP